MPVPGSVGAGAAGSGLAGSGAAGPGDGRPGAGPPSAGPPDEAAVRDALSDWRQDAVLIGVLPLLCWPALIGALVTRPEPLRMVLLGLLCLPVLVALRELYAVQRVRRALRDPEPRWIPYDAEVLRGGWLPPVLALRGVGDGVGASVVTLGALGRRVLAPRAWAGTAAPGVPEAAGESGDGGPAVERRVWLAGEAGPVAVVWAPHSRALGRARGAWRKRRRTRG